MKNALVLGVAFLALGKGIASAQTYYPTQSYGATYSATSYGTAATGCVTISRDLWYGSRGTDVLMLQSFLVNQNYAGGGSWMVTGYFGAATQTAVRIFQSQRGLSQTGIVDATTRAA